MGWVEMKGEDRGKQVRRGVSREYDDVSDADDAVVKDGVYCWLIALGVLCPENCF